MKISPNWIRDFVDLTVDDHRLAEDLTNAGIAVEGINGTGADTIFEMEIGTNRPDAMNHYGVAREAAAIYDVPLKPIAPNLPSAAKAAAYFGDANAGLKARSSTTQDASVARVGSGGAAGSRSLSKPTNHAPFPITVEEAELCPRFTGRVIRRTRITSSPEKIARRLQLLDQRPISNAVDATNYVLWEIGKPTHVFDLDLLEGGKIIVRKARDGETLKTLDGVERKLSTEDVVVCDARKPVGLAGVMGGYDTMITEKTRNVLIESAWWDPGIIRKTSRRHGLHTDASHRFERGADFDSCVLSCDLVADLILTSGGGELVGDVVDVVSKRMDQAPVVLHVAEVRRILGGELDAGLIFRLLKRLGFTLVPEGEGEAKFRVQIPSWRLDVEREIDLIEEIARLHGYDKFKNTLPAYSGAVVELPHAEIDATFRKRALALGYNEALSLTFISHADAEKFSPDAAVLELENPLSEEASVMRTSLVPGMLDMLAWNLNRDVPEARLFEIGSVYELAGGFSGEARVEPKRMCLGTTLSGALKALAPGSPPSANADQDNVAKAFRSFKGDVESILAPFATEGLSFDRATAQYLQDGRSARAVVGQIVMAQFGQLGLGLILQRKLRQYVFVAEFDLDRLYELGPRIAKFTPLSKFPAVQRDFSFRFSDAVLFGEMHKGVTALQIPELREFDSVEVRSLTTGLYSILLRAKFQSDDRTLRDDEVAEWSAKIVTALTNLGGSQRI